MTLSLFSQTRIKKLTLTFTDTLLAMYVYKKDEEREEVELMLLLQLHPELGPFSLAAFRENYNFIKSQEPIKLNVA